MAADVGIYLELCTIPVQLKHQIPGAGCDMLMLPAPPHVWSHP